jgi:2OG-Fe(II) oxygenase superfamily
MIIEASPQQYGFFDPRIAETGKQFQAVYKAAQPFPHIVLDNFLNEAALEYCLAHFPAQPESRTHYDRSQERLKFEFSPENLEPPLRSMFYSFNSLPFIRFLEGLTGIQGLIPDPYFAGAGFHQVSHGGHLGIHADFDRHAQMGLERRINVLIYLNKDWKEEYGGSFEIWDQAMKVRCLQVAPLFNRCVVFNTSATSFHGNPEPVNHPQRLPRRSIALYYYTATWEETRRARTTQFKVRPGSADRFDLGLRTSEFAADVMPPILLRAFRKLRRSLAGPRTKGEKLA